MHFANTLWHLGNLKKRTLNWKAYFLNQNLREKGMITMVALLVYYSEPILVAFQEEGRYFSMVAFWNSRDKHISECLAMGQTCLLHFGKNGKWSSALTVYEILFYGSFL